MLPTCEDSTEQSSDLKLSKELSNPVSVDSVPDSRAPSISKEAPLTEKADHVSADKPSPSIEHDEFEVDWNQPADQDPDNPMAWPQTRKVTIVGLVSFVAFLTPLASSMFAPGIPRLMEDFNSSSSILATFVVSVYVLGFAFGPLIIAPVSEILGRSIVYHTCNISFVIFTICNALSVNMGMMLVFRFLAGFAGVAATTIGSGTVTDMIPVQRRGLYMALWSTGPIFGPIIGPIAGGYLIEQLNWRWTFWVIAMSGGVSTVLCFLILPETLASVILERKAAKLRKSTGDERYQSHLRSHLTHKQLWLSAIVRPVKILLFSPVASFMCLYIAVLFGLLYILFTTFTYVFKDQYQFGTQAAGLSYLGSGIGTLSGLGYGALFSDRRINVKLRAGQPVQPEDRLPFVMIIPGVLFVPVGFFIYGWGADFQVHWIVPEIGTAVQSFGSMIIIFCVNTYLVDSYDTNSASAIAANAVLRNLAGALVPMGGLKVYDALGIGWGNTLLGFISLAIAPIPILFSIYGQRLRERHLKKETVGTGAAG